MDDLQDWLSAADDLADSQNVPRGDYQQCLLIREQDSGDAVNMPRGNPWVALEGLRLLPEDKSYLHGFTHALQLPDGLTYALLCHYRKRWLQAQQRSTNKNSSVNAGRRAANIWIQQGAKGFVQWQEPDKPP